ncbi:MAG: 5-formyltetrahydrofolate cyclo-ligase [Pseudomonadota bacterium]
MLSFILFPGFRGRGDFKGAFRDKLRVERAAAHAARPDAPAHAARLFMDQVPRAKGTVVALYHPLKDELDTGPLAEALHDAGHPLALPVVTAKNAPLEFRTYTPGDALVKGDFNVMTPPSEAPVVKPDIIVAPLLGFTKAGARLGYGGGFYDRTLEALRSDGEITAVGFAYGAQEVQSLPTGAHDEFLDWIVTERAALKATETRRPTNGALSGLWRRLGL